MFKVIKGVHPTVTFTSGKLTATELTNRTTNKLGGNA